jgi:hypothetical protein
MEGFDEDALLSAFARLPQVAPELKTDQAIPALLYRQIFALDRDLIGTST